VYVVEHRKHESVAVCDGEAYLVVVVVVMVVRDLVKVHGSDFVNGELYISLVLDSLYNLFVVDSLMKVEND
jgi:hypothetical protein